MMDNYWLGLGLAFLGVFLATGMIALGYFVRESVARICDAIPGAVARACGDLADARRYEADVRGGIVRPPEQEREKEPEGLAQFRAWLASEGFTDEERDDLDGRAQVVFGLRAVPLSVREGYRKSLETLGAPIPAA